MAHFAQIDPDTNLVLRVITISNDVTHDDEGIEYEERGIKLCQQLYGANTIWKQTSYHGNFRGCYAGIYFLYDAERDEFMPPAT